MEDPGVVLEKIKNNEPLDERTVKILILHSMDLFHEDSNVLLLKKEENLPIIICGDIHGQLEDLFELFATAGGENSGTFLFMGDYVDRGHYSIDTICYLLALRLKYGNVYLLRGNHESRNINQTYGFYEECIQAYNTPKIYDMFNNLFDLFPIAAVIDGKVFAVHAGLSPKLPLIEDLQKLDRKREIPISGPFTDLMWSDPSSDVSDWVPSQRGSGYLFGKLQTHEFLYLNKLDFMTRSHQLARDGYQYLFEETENGKPLLVTIWSAPNYAYVEQNSASIMKFEGNRNPKENPIIVFEAATNRRPDRGDDIVTPYFA